VAARFRRAGFYSARWNRTATKTEGMAFRQPDDKIQLEDPFVFRVFALAMFNLNAFMYVI
jgi:hypothetical protein